MSQHRRTIAADLAIWSAPVESGFAVEVHLRTHEQSRPYLEHNGGVVLIITLVLKNLGGSLQGVAIPISWVYLEYQP